VIRDDDPIRDLVRRAYAAEPDHDQGNIAAAWADLLRRMDKTGVALPADRDIRVLLVDDQKLARSGLRRILTRRDGFMIAGECEDGSEVLPALDKTEVDVVVMDMRMPNVDGVEATRRLRKVNSQLPVMALTTFDDDQLFDEAVSAGVQGYVIKDVSSEDLMSAVRTVAAGGAWLDPAVAGRVLTNYRPTAPASNTTPKPAANRRRRPAPYGHAANLLSLPQQPPPRPHSSGDESG
jgi:DNA-binding NarL/FixJ family response regulator